LGKVPFFGESSQDPGSFEEGCVCRGRGGSCDGALIRISGLDERLYKGRIAFIF